MFNREGKLDIFEDFRIDETLPKYARPRAGSRDEEDGEEEMFGANDSLSMAKSSRPRRRQFMVSSNGGSISIGIDGEMMTEVALLRQMQPTWLQRVLMWLLARVSPDDKKLVWRPLIDPPAPAPTVTILEFFSAVKRGTTNLDVVEGRVQGYEAALARARATGQTALREQLEEGIEAVRAETRLLDLGLTTVLSEETLVEFVKKCPKGLRLDWVKNFTRFIPDEVLDQKKRCDEEQIFDNYVVLHYDPEAKSWAETHQDRAARRDPILFGVLAGRRQLYFVGEWVDEYCDLSLDQIADTLGRRPEDHIDPGSFTG